MKQSASVSALLFLALLATMAWMPEALVQSVSVPGLSRSSTLTMLGGLGCVLALLTVIRLSRFPMPFRATIGILAVYGLAAFLTGFRDAVPFHELMSGSSLWRQLPFWMQGAFLGALIAVPLALVASLVDAVRRVRLGDGKSWGFKQSLALGLCFLAAIPGTFTSARPAGSVMAQTDARPSAADLTRPMSQGYRELVAAFSDADQPKASSKDFAGAVDDLVVVAKETLPLIPRESFDLAAVLGRVGRDPVKLFEWVRDETQFVSYRGLLRGSMGVLLDRRGNSLDRAVLLHALLRDASVPARLARGMLSSEQARRLLERTRTTSGKPKPAVGLPASTASLGESANQDKIGEALRRLAEERRRLADGVQLRVRTQTSQLLSSVDRKPSESLQSAELERQVEAAREHWWVEYQADGVDMVLDPTLPDAAPGSKLADETTARMDPNDVARVNGTHAHVLRVQVVLEVVSASGRKEVIALDHELLPADLNGGSLRLQFHPVGWPRDRAVLNAPNPPDAFREVALAQREWLPVLSVGGQVVSKFSFNDQGQLTVPAQPALGQGAQDLGRSILGQLGGGSRRPATPPLAAKPADQEVTALWIDFTLRSSDQGSRTIRRQVFDVLGPATRASRLPRQALSEVQRLHRALALLGDTQVLPVVAGFSREFVQHLAVSNFLANHDALRKSYADLERGDLDASAGTAAKAPSLPWNLYDLAIARLAWSPVQADVYFDAINVLSFYKRPCANDLGQLRLCEGIDIVANEVGVVQRPGLDPFATRLVQGVTDTNAEAIILSNAPQRDNISEIAVRGEAEGVKWQTITDASQVMPSAGTEDVRERIRQDVTAGHVVVTADRAVLIDGKRAVGWWRVDPRTGSVLGIGPQGGGQVSTETAITIAVFTGAAVAVVSYLGCVGVEGGGSTTKHYACATCAIIDAFAVAAAVFAILTTGPGAVLSGQARRAAVLAVGTTMSCQLLGAFGV